MTVAFRASPSVSALVVVLPIALVLSGCGDSERDSSRLAAMLEAKYGLNVISCGSRGEDAVRLTGRWRCDLSSPRTDDVTGVTGTVWCVTDASPDGDFEGAHLAYPRADGCR